MGEGEVSEECFLALTLDQDFLSAVALRCVALVGTASTGESYAMRLIYIYSYTQTNQLFFILKHNKR